jgi:hypothetical protein
MSVKSGGMRLTEDGIAPKGTCLGTTFFTTNPTRNNLGLNPYFRGEESINMWLSQ